MKQEDVYIPVSVEERLPSPGSLCFCLYISELPEEVTINEFLWYNHAGEWKHVSDEDQRDMGNPDTPTHWLEKKTNLILCTKQDLTELFYKGGSMGMESPTRVLREYLESKEIKL
jgi:hypothetical protein